jgi:hypothetical protein
MFIGAQVVKIWDILMQNIIQHNIKKICADEYYIRLIAYMFCEGVLNYSHSCSSGRVRTQMHRHSIVLREPHSSEGRWHVRSA